MEQDDIDFDEEELKGERDEHRPNVTDDVDDEPMSAAEIEAMDRMESESSMPLQPSGTPVPPTAASSSRAGSITMAAPPPAAPKRRMIITHDKYMNLQSLIVLHLSGVERQTGRGIDRDELIDWYLEKKESEIQDVEELEYEKELVTKMLRKLVKVGVVLSETAL